MISLLVADGSYILVAFFEQTISQIGSPCLRSEVEKLVLESLVTVQLLGLNGHSQPVVGSISLLVVNQSHDDWWRGRKKSRSVTTHVERTHGRDCSEKGIAAE